MNVFKNPMKMKKLEKCKSKFFAEFIKKKQKTVSSVRLGSTPMLTPHHRNSDVDVFPYKKLFDNAPRRTQSP